MGEAIITRFQNVNINDIAVQINGYEFITINCPARTLHMSKQCSLNYPNDKVEEMHTVFTSTHNIRAAVLVGATGSNTANTVEHDSKDDYYYTASIGINEYMNLVTSRAKFDEGNNMTEVAPTSSLVIAGTKSAWGAWVEFRIPNSTTIQIGYYLYNRYTSVEMAYCSFNKFSFLCKVEYDL